MGRPQFEQNPGAINFGHQGPGSCQLRQDDWGGIRPTDRFRGSEKHRLSN